MECIGAVQELSKRQQSKVPHHLIAMLLMLLASLLCSVLIIINIYKY